ncbi:Scr1 family TA system antitoxin-like transcriptional regulator [Streptomyces sp. NPDC005576]|uniref:Scr1 family TA system antitoxin-like transcriptional regulator n=1 Tax=Streptomyces sp. NPDC005576 TaxID=3364726 RepID=UPI0036BD2CE2
MRARSRRSTPRANRNLPPVAGPPAQFRHGGVRVTRGLSGREVRRGQLEHLLLIGEKRNIEIQVMPSDREDNAGVDGPFTVLTPQHGEPVGYLEVQGRSTLVTERAEVRALSARFGRRSPRVSRWPSSKNSWERYERPRHHGWFGSSAALVREQLQRRRGRTVS